VYGCAYFGVCVHIIAEQIPGLSRTSDLDFWDIPGPGNIKNTIPGLSRTLHLHFRDFPGPGNFTNTIPGLFRNPVLLDKCNGRNIVIKN